MSAERILDVMRRANDDLERKMTAELDKALGAQSAVQRELAELRTKNAELQRDLEQATQLARAMVTRYGMSNSTGLVAYEYDRQAEATKAKIEGEVRKLVMEAYDRAKALLTKHEKELHKLAEELLNKETLSGKQINELLGKKTNGNAAV